MNTPPDTGPGAARHTHAVSALDDELADTVLRFLKSSVAENDRRVLAPLHLQELVYRILQRDQRLRLVGVAALSDMNSPIAAALDFICAHLAEPLSVEALAAEVCLSPSAFSRQFRDVTGRSPYQYVKEVRLNRARRLLGGRRLGVACAARAVGYASVSHFIKEFRNRYGETPGEYAAGMSLRPSRFDEFTFTDDSVA